MAARDWLCDTIKCLLGTSINEISTDGTLAGDSDDAVPTEKAVKTYADALSGSVVTESGTFVDGDLDGSDDLTITRGAPGDQYPTAVAVYNGSDVKVEVPFDPASTTDTVLDLTGWRSIEGGALIGTWKYRLIFNS